MRNIMAKITILENGDVHVEQAFFNGEEMDRMDRTFTARGAYVYQVFLNGTESQTCEGLRPTGPTLRAGPDLAEVIRKTLEK